MTRFGKFFLDKEKDIIVELNMDDDELSYVLRTPNHKSGNLITNLAALCALPLDYDENGLKVIRGIVPCYVDDANQKVYIFRMGDTKVANIYPDGTIERKAAIPAISKTLMSQTKDYRLDLRKTLVKTYILRDCKFCTDLHTHMNANLDPDILIALGIHHQIRYPLYYIRKLSLHVTKRQNELLMRRRKEAEKLFEDSPLTGKYLTRKIDDNTFINFADLILNNPANADENIIKIRSSLAIMKDGQAVFTNLEKVYLYRYVFTRGIADEEVFVPCKDTAGKEPGEQQPVTGKEEGGHSARAADKSLPGTPAAGADCDGVEKETRRRIEALPDKDISRALLQMRKDRDNPDYAHFTLFQNKLLWIARGAAAKGIRYMEISDTTLVKKDQAAHMLALVHEAMPAVTRETGVVIRFLAALRRIPLTIVKDQIHTQENLAAQLSVLEAVAPCPYVAGSDIIGEEINDIRDLKSTVQKLVQIAGKNPGFVIRIHAGENDSLRDNVANSLRCVKDALAPGQKMPPLRIGHGLYTANLKSPRGRALIDDLRESKVVLEFQITSNVRLNNLSALEHHPLRQYLEGGIYCVQGTDGGAIYGTDSIDEQLSLEKLLNLDHDQLLAMHRAELKVMKNALLTFHRKQEAFEKMKGQQGAEAYLGARIAENCSEEASGQFVPHALYSKEVLQFMTRPMPEEKVPIVLLGGSYNSDSHTTRMRPEYQELIKELVRKCSPDEVFFVTGDRLSAYERELIRMAEGRFDIFAMVPAQITPAHLSRLKKEKISVCIAIEPTAMGIYKSLAYEIFKRRPSVVLALDGNSSGANIIQEAKNGKRKARIFAARSCRAFLAKARTLEGYVNLIDGPEQAGEILAAISDVREEMRVRPWPYPQQ